MDNLLKILNKRKLENDKIGRRNPEIDAQIKKYINNLINKRFLEDKIKFNNVAGHDHNGKNSKTWLQKSWTPVLSGQSLMTITDQVISYATYIKIGKFIIFSIAATFTVGGTPNVSVYFTLPETALNANTISFSARVRDAASGVSVIGMSFKNDTLLGAVRKSDASNWTAGASRVFAVSGFFASLN